MLPRAKAIFARSGKSLPAAALLTLGTLLYCSGPVHALTLSPRQALVALCLFPMLFVALRLFGHGCRERLALHVGTEDAPSRGLMVFVFYKEAVKTAVGVSLTLAWFAGLLFVAERFADSVLVVPVAAGVLVSLLVLGFAQAFAAFVDLIPYPWGE